MADPKKDARPLSRFGPGPLGTTEDAERSPDNVRSRELLANPAEVLKMQTMKPEPVVPQVQLTATDRRRIAGISLVREDAVRDIYRGVSRGRPRAATLTRIRNAAIELGLPLPPEPQR